MVVLSFNSNDKVNLFSFAVVENDIEEYWNKIKEYTPEQLESTNEVSIVFGNKDKKCYTNVYTNAYELFKHLKAQGIWFEERHTIFRTLGHVNGTPSIEYILKTIIESVEPDYFRKRESKKDEILSNE